ALSFIASALYLNLDRALKQKTSFGSYHKFPSLEGLERFIFRTVLWGLFLLGFAIVTGALWAKTAFNTFILREPKSLASLLTWGVYLVIIYFHMFRQIKGRRIVQMSFGAFVLVLFTFLGTSFFQKGLHVGAW
ncbi:MAG: cytochrome c biogenesis protein CcsA, partial [Candidatus Omnitrophica bacterium]|nr:cytochrome c biogenesis protein CcsA [Candidatus Omnitrophota bacterium]